MNCTSLNKIYRYALVHLYRIHSRGTTLNSISYNQTPLAHKKLTRSKSETLVRRPFVDQFYSQYEENKSQYF